MDRIHLASHLERQRFEGVTIVSESLDLLVIRSPRSDRLSGEYCDRIQAAAEDVRSGLRVEVRPEVAEATGEQVA